MQRDELCEALAEVNRHEPGSPLAKLFQIIHKTEGGHWVVNFQSAEGATLHSGTTRLSVKKGRPGSVEDCYAFVPFERGPGEDAELCIMEVQGIGALRWLNEQEDIDLDEPIANIVQQAGGNAQFPGACTKNIAATVAIDPQQENSSSYHAYVDCTIVGCNLPSAPLKSHSGTVASVILQYTPVSHAGQEKDQAEQGAAEVQLQADETTVKLAWGKLWTCGALDSPGGTTAYSSYKPPTPNNPGTDPQPHCLPSLLTQEGMDDAIQYAVELRYVQATCLNGRIPLGVDVNGPHMQVFAPYRPVGSHG